MRGWRKYAKTLTMGLQSSLEYRVNFLLGLLSCLFPILIQIFLWNAIFRSTGEGGVFGYTEGEAIAYAVLAALFSRMVATGFEYEIAGDVKNGQLSKFVVQPIHYFAFRLCTFLGEKILHIAVIGCIIAVAVAILHNVIAWDAARFAAALLALVLAVAINFLIYYNLSMIAFWMVEVWGVFLTFSLLANVASGGIFPLDMFGSGAQAVLNVLPFKYIVFFPVHVLLGKLAPGELLPGLLVQLMWIAVLYSVSVALWRVGMRKYESAGG